MGIVFKNAFAGDSLSIVSNRVVEMPFELVKRGAGFQVRNKDTGKVYSKKPLQKAKAEGQLRVLNSIYYAEKK